MGVDEFAALGEGRRELVHGEVIEMAPTGGRHGDLAMELGRLLANHVRSRRLGKVYAAETGFILSHDPATVRAADMAFVARARVIKTDEGFLDQAPDLAVEILSPSDRYAAVDEKTHCWLDAGTRQVWVVDPETERVQVFRRGAHPLDLGPDDELTGGDVIPGFGVRLQDLFGAES